MIPPIQPNTEPIWEALQNVCDPEIPVLTILDLGIVRNVQWLPDNTLQITITPTYTGCPAMNTIEWDIRATLAQQGYANVQIITVLTPVWTTDWLTDEGKNKLQAYGIAPPIATSLDKTGLFAEPPRIPCPLCHSTHTRLVSQFGSTACKALYQCLHCNEPFDYFKCH